jgi:CRISPR-associated protein Csx14
MAEASIPVHLRNPGQVFACLGFLEAAEILLGDAEGGFDWSNEADVRFRLRAAGDSNPFEHVLDFLANAKVEEVKPTDVAPAATDKDERRPIRLRTSRAAVPVGHWADGSSRNSFKQFAGNQSAYQNIVPPLIEGISRFWEAFDRRGNLVAQPFDGLCPLGGSFKFDAREAWTPRNVGYSIDEQKQRIDSSPVVELLAAVGLEHARPWVDPKNQFQVRYGVWSGMAPATLARAALGGAYVGFPRRLFGFTRNSLGTKGEYKQVTFANEEVIS